MNFTLRQLELFVALSGHPTLSSAAAALHISESALSHSVSELERAVGEQLCVRRKARGLRLTPAGQFFASRARGLISDADALVGQLSGGCSELKGPIKIGCYTGLASVVLPPVLDGFARTHPGLEIGLNVGTDDELFPAVDSGILDLAIVYDMFLPKGLRRRPVYRTEVLVALPGDHRLATRSEVDLVELGADPFIMLDTAPSAENSRKILAEHGIEPNMQISVPDLDLVRVLVGRGLGYSLLMWRPNGPTSTHEGRPIAMVPLSPQAGETDVVAVWSEHVTPSRRAMELVDYLIQALGDAVNDTRRGPDRGQEWLGR